MKFYSNFILLILIFSLFGCKKEEKTDYVDLIEVLDNSKDAVFDTLSVPEYLIPIVKQISGINTYETGVLGKGVTESPNFENFKKLNKLASEDELLSLLNNKNKTVAVYASIGILDKKPELIDKIFLSFLNMKTKIHTQNGCIIGDQNLAEPLYRKYLYSLDDKAQRSDRMLQKLDSIIIFGKNSPESLLQEALRYKVYPKNYRKRIEILAFKEHKIPAIRYLSHWHKGDYSGFLQKELISLVENDSLGDIQNKMYLSDLLSFRNPNNKDFILNYIKKDTLYSNEYEILHQLESNGIQSGEYPTK